MFVLCVYCITRRPLEILTDEYGKKWTGLTNEKIVKIQTPPSIKTAAQFMDAVRSLLNLHPIQLIGMRYSCIKHLYFIHNLVLRNIIFC